MKPHLLGLFALSLLVQNGWTEPKVKGLGIFKKEYTLPATLIEPSGTARKGTLILRPRPYACPLALLGLTVGFSGLKAGAFNYLFGISAWDNLLSDAASFYEYRSVQAAAVWATSLFVRNTFFDRFYFEDASGTKKRISLGKYSAGLADVYTSRYGVKLQHRSKPEFPTELMINLNSEGIASGAVLVFDGGLKFPVEDLVVEDDPMD